EIGAHDSGGMLHVYVDDSKEYEAVTSTETMLGVPDGTHTIRVVLSDANHQETSVSDSVSVSVSGAPPTVCCGLPKQTGGPEDPGGTGETDDGTADTGGGGYDYNY
ncbi:MAG TPA: hypothetical protein VG602_04225, partial [Actinomycetota bacterium]|nr:hypothetical protein [Actinomycetota bacterium]